MFKTAKELWTSFLPKTFIILAATASAVSHADMNGYVAPGPIFGYSLTKEKGNYIGGHIEFARLTSYIALDARILSNKNYSTFSGGVLKFYYPWEVNQNLTLQFGTGVGGMYTSGPKNVEQPFIDFVAHPFISGLWIFNENWGLISTLGMDISPIRNYRGKDPKPKDDKTMRYMTLFSIGVAFGA